MLEINTLLRTPNGDVALKDLPTLPTLYDQHNNEIKGDMETIKEDLADSRARPRSARALPTPLASEGDCFNISSNATVRFRRTHGSLGGRTRLTAFPLTPSKGRGGWH